MADSILEIQDLVVEYHTDDAIIHAVNNVNLVVRQGETLGLVGETGAGKTTIARSILRILQTPPAKFCGGRILFKDQDLTELSEQEMGRLRKVMLQLTDYEEGLQKQAVSPAVP